MPPSTPPSPQVPPQHPPIHTYHCICSTLLLATPYIISHLPIRAHPSKDQARILPLPPLHNPIGSGAAPPTTSTTATTTTTIPDPKTTTEQKHQKEQKEQKQQRQQHYPSLLLPALRSARKSIMVQREDGFERRRVWRCGRCGVVVGYELEREKGGKEVGRVVFLLEGGLVETGEMVGVGGGGGEVG